MLLRRLAQKDVGRQPNSATGCSALDDRTLGDGSLSFPFSFRPYYMLLLQPFHLGVTAAPWADDGEDDDDLPLDEDRGWFDFPSPCLPVPPPRRRERKASVAEWSTATPGIGRSTDLYKVGCRVFRSRGGRAGINNNVSTCTWASIRHWVSSMPSELKQRLSLSPFRSSPRAHFNVCVTSPVLL